MIKIILATIATIIAIGSILALSPNQYTSLAVPQAPWPVIISGLSGPPIPISFAPSSPPVPVAPAPGGGSFPITWGNLVGLPPLPVSLTLSPPILVKPEIGGDKFPIQIDPAFLDPLGGVLPTTISNNPSAPIPTICPEQFVQHGDKIVFTVSQSVSDNDGFDLYPGRTYDIKVLDDPAKVADLNSKVVQFAENNGVTPGTFSPDDVTIVDVGYAIVCSESSNP